MVRELRRTHLRLWLVLGPLLVLMTGAVLLSRGPRPIQTAEQAASATPALPPVEPGGEREGAGEGVEGDAGGDAGGAGP
ncbi:MAG: hypothetical protein ACI89L_001033 [Phycisphaerales bacterium]|jgi:hypothetical protein